jgi:hypothetical protein
MNGKTALEEPFATDDALLDSKGYQQRCLGLARKSGATHPGGRAQAPKIKDARALLPRPALAGRGLG